MHSRSLMGTPSNLSKKGVPMHNALQRQGETQIKDTIPMAPIDHTMPPKVIEPTSEGMVSKRTEWLEQQERRLTATVQEQRNEHEKMKKHLESVEQRSRNQAMQLFQDSQWLYGYTKGILRGISSENGQLYSALDAFKTAPDTPLVELAPTGRWVLLSYPMEQVDTKEGPLKLMKMRTVDPETGQLGLSWAVVSDDRTEGPGRVIDEFAVAPHSR